MQSLRPREGKFVTAVSSDVVCTRIAQRLANSVGSQRYNMWFGRSAKLDYEDQDRCLCVSVPNRFVADWIDRNFESELRQAADAEVGQGVELKLDISPDRFTDSAAPAATPSASKARSAPAATTRRRSSTAPLKHSPDDFVVGASNKLAFAAAGSIVGDKDNGMSPLFLHGGCGMGKTHLLQGLCRQMLDRRPNASVLYLTGEQFTNQFLEAVRAGGLPAFRRKLRRLDLLAIDDVRFIADKRATQQEFLHTFNAIELGGARVALASDCHPRLIKQFSEALVSRCIRGMVVQIDPPDADTRLRIVKALAQKRGLAVNESVARFIADRCVGSVRHIEGTLTKVQALASLTRGPDGRGVIEVGHALVDHLFDADLAPKSRRAVTFPVILQTVCDQLAVRKDQVLSSNRHRNVVLARSLAIYLARQMTSMSYPEISAAMGRSSHSTVITACKRIQTQIAAAQPVDLAHIAEQTTLDSLASRLKHAVAQAAGE